MIKLLLLILCTIVMMALFAAALHFSRYKKRKPGCGCGAPRDNLEKISTFLKKGGAKNFYFRV